MNCVKTEIEQFPWKESYRVGIAEIDSKHKLLAQTVSDLYFAVSAKERRNDIARSLSRLVAVTRELFAAEEFLLRKAGYPHYLAHRMEHDAIAAAISRLQQDLESGASVPDIETIHRISGWLTSHFLETDQRYASYFRTVNIS